MKIKIDKRDKVFSLLIRCRANYTCEKCGKFCGETGDFGKLECSHIFSRTFLGLRWHPDNGMAKCFSCHKWWHSNPTESGIWIRNKLGEGFIDLLTEKKNQITKYPKVVKEDIHKHLKAELGKMLELRKYTDARIEFESFD